MIAPLETLCPRCQGKGLPPTATPPPAPQAPVAPQAPRPSARPARKSPGIGAVIAGAFGNLSTAAYNRASLLHGETSPELFSTEMVTLEMTIKSNAQLADGFRDAGN